MYLLQKQYSDLFALAAEDETTVVGRRGGSGRGRKQPTSKKDANSHGSGNKKNSDQVKGISFTSDEESSEVYCKQAQTKRKQIFNFQNLQQEDWSKQKISQAKKRKKALNDSD